MSLLELFCAVDDFCQVFQAQLQSKTLSTPHSAKPGPKSKLCASEIMTLMIHFHQSNYRTFKHYYTQYVRVHLAQEFPGLVSYTRFVELIPQALIGVCAYLSSLFAQCTGLSFVDSTSLKVCHPLRISSHKVFAGLAQKAKNSLGWFYGFKLHFVCNEQGQLLKARFTLGNLDDRKGLKQMLQGLFGKLFGDRGYIGQALMQELWQDWGIHLITGLRRNMHTLLPQLHQDRVLLRKRAIVESIIDQLKNISQLEHTRHRSIPNFMVHVVCALIAYSLQPKKPSLHLSSAIALSPN